jgi:hypothetical protein
MSLRLIFGPGEKPKVLNAFYNDCFIWHAKSEDIEKLEEYMAIAKIETVKALNMYNCVPSSLKFLPQFQNVTEMKLRIATKYRENDFDFLQEMTPLTTPNLTKLHIDSCLCVLPLLRTHPEDLTIDNKENDRTSTHPPKSQPSQGESTGQLATDESKSHQSTSSDRNKKSLIENLDALNLNIHKSVASDEEPTDQHSRKTPPRPTVNMGGRRTVNMGGRGKNKKKKETQATILKELEESFNRM